jgi:hypothetical protein
VTNLFNHTRVLAVELIFIIKVFVDFISIKFFKSWWNGLETSFATVDFREAKKWVANVVYT